MNQPLVSIIIINWNGGDVLKNCLASLEKLDYPNWELILVDNGSIDNSETYPSRFKLFSKRQILIKNEKNLGFAPANNQGYKKAKGEYILLLNNDTKVSPNFLSKMVERMEEDTLIGAMQPKIYLMDKPTHLDNTGSFLTRTGFLKHWGFMEKNGKEFDDEKLIFSAKGACMLIRREVIDKVGLFDDDFGSYFEESDFCWRVWLIGFKVLYFPETFILHKVGFTTRRQDVSNINFMSYKNRICSLIKNLEVLNLVQILGLHLILSFCIAVMFLIKLQPKYSLIVLKAIFWNFLNLESTLKKRTKVQSMRQINDQELFKTILQPFDFLKSVGDFNRIEQDLKR